ncbi:hypothetical protein [Sediminimonas sp.]|uniref:hypothetical protein n=1 Tax=Sediminimonas sp. TaxID=2823379 RepID=UPI0025D44814|nr:hypothetical protein [Sediminimonas sp.]
MRTMFFPAALAALMLALPLHAESAIEVQDWIPEALTMPEDAEVKTDRAIGSSIRLFEIVTAEKVDTLLARWSEALEEEGYRISKSSAEMDIQQIEFTGPGIGNAKISVAPSALDGRNVLSFDASLTP